MEILCAIKNTLIPTVYRKIAITTCARGGQIRQQDKDINGIRVKMNSRIHSKKKYEVVLKNATFFVFYIWYR